MPGSKALLVSDDQTLADVVARCLRVSRIAIDTEFIRTDTFYPIPALIQIFDGQQCYLIDPLCISCFQPLIDLFSEQSVEKVVHSCGEDLEVFSSLLGVLPTPLFDTQIAAGLIGLEFSMGYQNLVQGVLGKEISKDETRSDWLQRPLTSKQLDYAANDVIWLLDVYQHLQQRLCGLGRDGWLLQECSAVLERALSPAPIEQYYLRIRAARKLDRQELHLLRALSTWREKEARHLDVPRSRVISDANLVEIVKVRPRDKFSLSSKTGLSPRVIRRYSEALVAIVIDALADEIAGHPPLLSASDSTETRAALKKMKREVKHVADQLGLPVEVLAKRKDLEAYYFADDPSEALLNSGWRAPLLAERLAPLRIDSSAQS